MFFEDAIELAERINNQPGWTAELTTDGDEESTVFVSAQYNRHGLIYSVELETVDQWAFHLQRIAAWERSRR